MFLNFSLDKRNGCRLNFEHQEISDPVDLLQLLYSVVIYSSHSSVDTEKLGNFISFLYEKHVESSELSEEEDEEEEISYFENIDEFNESKAKIFAKIDENKPVAIKIVSVPESTKEDLVALLGKRLNISSSQCEDAFKFSANNKPLILPYKDANLAFDIIVGYGCVCVVRNIDKLVSISDDQVDSQIINPEQPAEIFNTNPSILS